jgi:cell division protein FtsZ
MEKDLKINRRQFLTNTSLLSVGVITSLPIIDSFMQYDLKKNIEKNLKSEKIKIIGVGGGGNNTLNSLIDFNLKGVQFIAVNTDFKSLEASKAPIKLFIGEKIAKRKGANGNPLIGRGAAFQSAGVIKKTFIDSHMVFISAGLGGGTGTGAAPVIAKICKDIGAQVIAIVSTPFSFEGEKRNKQADEGLLALKKIVDTIVVRPNDRIRERVVKDDTISYMFKKADENIYHLIKGIITQDEVKPNIRLA